MKITGSKFKGLKLSKEIEKLQLKAWALKRQTQFGLSPFLIYCKEEMNWTAIAGTGKTAIFAIPVLESTEWEK
jgi:hypothetical protein